MARRVNTRKITDSAQAMPLPPGVFGVMWSNTQCQTHMIQETGQ